MKNLSFFMFLAALFFSTVSCQQPNATTEQNADLPTVETRTFEKSAGRDCDKADSLRTNCLTIRLAYPAVTNGTEALQQAVEKWATDFIVGLMVGQEDSTEAANIPLEEAAEQFAASHAEATADDLDAPWGQWDMETTDTVRLNDGKHLTLEIFNYSFTGGAHPNTTTLVATFDAQTGKQLTWDDLITDKAAVKALAEKKFREVRAEIFKDGFEFDDVFAFELPQSYGVVADGIYFVYVPYEVGPYVIGGTEFVLSFEELGKLSKL